MHSQRLLSLLPVILEEQGPPHGFLWIEILMLRVAHNFSLPASLRHQVLTRSCILSRGRERDGAAVRTMHSLVGLPAACPQEPALCLWAAVLSWAGSLATHHWWDPASHPAFQTPAQLHGLCDFQSGPLGTPGPNAGWASLLQSGGSPGQI